MGSPAIGAEREGPRDVDDDVRRVDPGQLAGDGVADARRVIIRRLEAEARGGPDDARRDDERERAQQHRAAGT